MTKTSNRKKFIEILDKLPIVSARTNYSYLVIREELIHLYDLNTKELNQEEINRLATAYKCPNCNCSDCLNTAEKEKERKF